MFCEQCGSQIDEGAVFCTNCGSRIATPEIAQPSAEDADHVDSNAGESVEPDVAVTVEEPVADAVSDSVGASGDNADTLTGTEGDETTPDVVDAEPAAKIVADEAAASDSNEPDPAIGSDETAALDFLHEEDDDGFAGFCEQCGSPLEPNAVFCAECGLAVGMAVAAGPNDTAVLSTVNVDHQVESPTERKPKGKKIWIAIVAIIVAAAVAGIVIWQMNAKDTPAEEAPKQEDQPKEEEKADEPASEEAQVVTTVPSTDQPVGGYPYFEYVKASSELPGDSVTSSYGPINAHDGFATTAWNEGASGNGTGEWIEFSSEGAQHITGIAIVGGYQQDPETYKKNCRPHDITITFDDGSKQVAHLKDEYGVAQSVIFTEPKTTRTMRITIDSVYGGDHFSDCCISEVVELPLYGDGTSYLNSLWEDPYSDLGAYDVNDFDNDYDALTDADFEHANGSEYILPFSDSSYYDKEYLEYYTDYELFIARNEIYARYGREFNNPDLVEWFSSTSWYYPAYTPEEFDAMPSPLNDYEKANVALIQEIENERGSSYR